MKRNMVPIVPEKLIDLYEQGYSIKEIALEEKISAPRVRACLQAAGFDTSSYRNVSKENKYWVVLMIKAGYSYRQIGEFLFLSHHLIREVVVEYHLLGFAPKNHAPIVLKNIPEISQELEDRFKELYLSGEYGLGKCATMLSLDDDQFLWFVYHITEEDFDKHYQNLYLKIREYDEEDFSVGRIAKIMDVSRSLVKDALK